MQADYRTKVASEGAKPTKLGSDRQRLRSGRFTGMYPKHSGELLVKTHFCNTDGPGSASLV